MKINISKTLLCDPTIGEFVKLLATAVTQQAQQVESMRSMLRDIHQQIYLLPTRREANAIKRTIIKAYTTNRKSVEEIEKELADLPRSLRSKIREATEETRKRKNDFL